MGRAVIAEDTSLAALKNLSKDSGYSFGLILGQSASQKDYVVYLAPSTAPAVERDAGKSTPEGGDLSSVKNLEDYDDSWIGSHTRSVMKMLPGGMMVLGVFVACPKASSDTAVFNKLRTLAIHSYNSIKNNNYLHLVKKSERLLLQYTSSNKTYVCKSVDAGSLSASLQPVDLKFSSEPFSWFSVNSSIDLINFGPHFISNDKENYTLKKMLKEMLSVIHERIVGSECSVDRKFVNMTDDVKSFKEKEDKKIKDLEKSTGKKLSFDPKSLEVQLYGRRVPNDVSFKVEDVEDRTEITFKGDISCRVFVVGSTSLEDTVKAVKEDLIRCCSSKFEMHWETDDEVIQSKSGGKKSEEIHILPRRVLFNLPTSDVQFSDYLFLDESAEDVIPSIQENLGILADTTSILDVLEAKSGTETVSSKPEVSQPGKSKTVTRSRTDNLIVPMIAISLIVLLISLYFQFA